MSSNPTGLWRNNLHQTRIKINRTMMQVSSDILQKNNRSKIWDLYPISVRPQRRKSIKQYYRHRHCPPISSACAGPPSPKPQLVISELNQLDNHVIESPLVLWYYVVDFDAVAPHTQHSMQNTVVEKQHIRRRPVSLLVNQTRYRLYPKITSSLYPLATYYLYRNVHESHQ